MAKKNAVATKAKDREMLTDADKAELTAYASGDANAIGVDAPQSGDGNGSSNANGGYAADAIPRPQRRKAVRDKNAIRAVYHVCGVGVKGGETMFLHSATTRRRADKWCGDNANLIRLLCSAVVIYRAKEVWRSL